MRISLKCGHVKNVKHGKPDYVYCGFCGKTVETVTDGYRVKCDKCRYSRRFGAETFAARIYATKHMLTTCHSVSLYDPAGVKVESFVSDQPELPLDGSPPF